MEPIRIQPRLFYAAIFLSLVTALSLPEIAFAHLDLVSSEPASGAVLDSPPEHVHLRFNEELDTFESSVAVFDSDGNKVDSGDSQVNLEDRSEIQVGLASDLAPGVYTIKWVAVDDNDGHPIEGEIQFTIVDSLPQPDRSPVFSPAIGLAILMLVGIVIFSVMFYLRKRKTDPQT